MHNILFICHGNICRSPMAEMTLRNLVTKEGRSKDFCIASCATSREEIFGDVGNPIYPPARAELQRQGIPCLAHQAEQLKKEDYDAYDLLICMDQTNVRNALRILGGDPAQKLRLLMDFTPRGGEVADPWYSDRFDLAYRDILEGCHGLLTYLRGDCKA